MYQKIPGYSPLAKVDTLVWMLTFLGVEGYQFTGSTASNVSTIRYFIAPV
jgi:hypothetical protein